MTSGRKKKFVVDGFPLKEQPLYLVLSFLSRLDFGSIFTENHLLLPLFEAPQHSFRALWTRTTINPDVNIGPLARPFACLLALLTHLLAQSFTCSPLLASLGHSAALIGSLVHSLIHSRSMRQYAGTSGYSEP